MIIIKDKKDCCGCSACVQICPKQCILLKEDNEGFLYPIIDKKTCINCGLCEKACPTLLSQEPQVPLSIYAAKNKDENIRLESSSGGIFSAIAEYIISQDGVVFGAQFDSNWEVKHNYSETLKGIASFRGSKYVQSRIEDNYQKVEIFLKQGRNVLFTGTPCQTAGLKSFLKKEYTNLLTIDILCHGVPSPKVWRMYLNECCNIPSIKPTNRNNITTIQNINFRDKKRGWRKFSFVLDPHDSIHQTISIHEPFYDNIFMKGFLDDLYLRPSCYQCQFKSGRSKSDICIADYWNILNAHLDFDDDKGVSLVLINSEKGQNIYNTLRSKFDSVQSNYDISQERNGGFKEIVKQHPNRKSFFNEMKKTHSITKTIEKHTKCSLLSQIKKHIKKIFVMP